MSVLRQDFERYWAKISLCEMDHVMIILEMEKSRSSFNVSFIKATHKIYAYSTYLRNLEKSTDPFEFEPVANLIS